MNIGPAETILVMLGDAHLRGNPWLTARNFRAATGISDDRIKQILEGLFLDGMTVENNARVKLSRKGYLRCHNRTFP